MGVVDDDGGEAGPDLDAGDFGRWSDGLWGALRGEVASDAPCDGCTACCTSSQFVHIAPDEVDTLAHIPGRLRFPAPGLPSGHVLLGYDDHGRCPLLGDAGCTIYDHRPRTCRVYDCRVFAATGLDVSEGDGTKVAIARRARRWRFTFAGPLDEDRWRAMRAEAAARRAEEGGSTTTTQLAVRAVAAVLEGR
jgi:Fe-S-cluster containining protein